VHFNIFHCYLLVWLCDNDFFHVVGKVRVQHRLDVLCALYDALWRNKDSVAVKPVQCHRVNQGIKVIAVVQMRVRDKDCRVAAHIDSAKRCVCQGSWSWVNVELKLSDLHDKPS
jgi:stage V sporulation protein SpoVS